MRRFGVCSSGRTAGKQQYWQHRQRCLSDSLVDHSSPSVRCLPFSLARGHQSTVVYPNRIPLFLDSSIVSIYRSRLRVVQSNREIQIQKDYRKTCAQDFQGFRYVRNFNDSLAICGTRQRDYVPVTCATTTTDSATSTRRKSPLRLGRLARSRPVVPGRVFRARHTRYTLPVSLSITAYLRFILSSGFARKGFVRSTRAFRSIAANEGRNGSVEARVPIERHAIPSSTSRGL